jgi:hypothetical protein
MEETKPQRNSIDLPCERPASRRESAFLAGRQ